MGAPLPADTPLRSTWTGPKFLAKYGDTYPWLRWGAHPLNESSVSSASSFEKVLYCDSCVEKRREVQKNGAPNPFYQGYREFGYRVDTLKSHGEVHVAIYAYFIESSYRCSAYCT